MAPLPFLPNQTQPQTRLSSNPKKKTTNKNKKTPTPQTQKLRHNKTVQPSSSWSQIKNLLSCKSVEMPPRVHVPSKMTSSSSSSCGSSLCKFSDVIYGNARVIHRSDHSPESSNLGQDAGLLTRKPNITRGSSSLVRSNGCGAYTSSYSASKAMHFRKLSGCYECHMIVDPIRYPIAPRICACPQCGEVFHKLETLELHQALRHAVSELGPEDSGRNIVDIIFKSSWLRKDTPNYNIERILKVHNTQRTIQRFEDCRDSVKSRARAHASSSSTTRKEPRSAADGNELLRFHCTTVSCSLGSNGSTSLCSAIPGCRVCTIIRHGFHAKTLRLGGGAINELKGVKTTSSSGRAHDALRCFDQRRAMLVCRVIAGRVRRVDSDAPDDESGYGTYDSVAGVGGVYTSLDDLAVFNPKAILPCFVVIYKVSDS